MLDASAIDPSFPAPELFVDEQPTNAKEQSTIKITFFFIFPSKFTDIIPHFAVGANKKLKALAFLSGNDPTQGSKPTKKSFSQSDFPLFADLSAARSDISLDNSPTLCYPCFYIQEEKKHNIMDHPSLIVTALILLLLASAFFSASETAFTSFSEVRMKKIAKTSKSARPGASTPK